MKPAPFTYHAPTTLPEALQLLQEYGYDAKVLAGGQSLVPLMNFRLARPAHLIDLGGIDGLSAIQEDGRSVRIGAMATHLSIESSPLLREVFPLLPVVAKHIGHVQIRARGTFGGSIAHADPSAEWPMVFQALNGQVRLASLAGERLVAAHDFFKGYLTTDLGPEEILVEVVLENPGPAAGWSFHEVTRRHGDFAIVAVLAVVELDQAGNCSGIRLCLGGVGGAPVNAAAQAQAILVGQPLTLEAAQEVARVVVAGLEPDDDLHASSEYRREVAATLMVRALTEAASKAQEGAA